MTARKKTLYYWPDTASFAPHICLNQTGADFDLIRMNLKGGKFTKIWYRNLNPNFRIPTYTEGDPAEGGLVLYEAAAICLHIAETHPNAGLLPPIGSDERAAAYKYLIYLTNTLQAELMIYNYTDRHCEDKAAIPTIRAAAEKRIGKMLGFLADELKKAGPWLAGQHHSCADHYFLMLAGWAEYYQIRNCPSENPELLQYLRRCQDFPAVRSAFEREGFEPYF